MRRSTLAVATAALALAACSRGCGRSTTAGIALSPLPDAPPLAIPPEALPGANGELAVVAARPQGPIEGEVRPTITFSKPIVAMGSVDRERELASAVTIEPALEGEWRWLGSATTEFVPKGLVPYATAFTVRVAKGLRAVDGAPLAEDYVFQFETPRPAVQAVTAEHADKWLTPREVVTMTFNQPVKDLAAHLRLKVGGEDGWPYDVKEVKVAEERRAHETGRRYARLGFEERGFMNRQIRYEITPRRPMPLDSAVELRIEGALAGAEGPLTMERGPEWSFRTYGPFRITGAKPCPWNGDRCAHGPVRLLTTNRADPKTLAKAITIEPKVDIDWDEVEASNEHLDLPAAFAPGTRYTVVATTARDAFGQPMAAPSSFEFRTDDLEPSYDVGSDVALLEAGGDGALPASAVNLSRLELQLVPLDPGAMARYLAKEPSDGFFASGLARTVDVSARKNVGRTVGLPVREILQGKGTTLFALRTEAPEVDGGDRNRWRRVRRVVGQVTDLAVHAKLGATKGVVWVTRLSDGKPVPNAEVAVHDRTGAARFSGRTDADGLAHVPGLTELVPAEGGGSWHGDTPFALVAARLGDDVGVTLSTWAGGLDPTAFDMPADWDGTAARELGGLWPERGIYRPGEKVKLKGLARWRRLGKIGTPEKGEVAVRVTSARGKEIFSGVVPLTAFGTWSAEVPVDADAPLGTCEVQAVVSTGSEQLSYGGSFRVEEYRAPQFQVDVVPAAKEVAAGDPVKAEVIARYLFGGAMPGAGVRWTATRRSTVFEPPGNVGFAFGPHSWWWDDGEPGVTADVAASGEGETSSTGLLVVDAGKAEATGGRTFTVTLEAEVTDVNRQRIANRAAVTVHPASVYAGVRRRATGFAEAGKPDVLELVAAQPDGARRAGLGVDVVVKKREWKWIRKKGVGGHWYTESEVSEERAGGCRVRTEATPVECTFTPPSPALYVAEATVTDEKGRKQTTRFPFYATGPGWVSWQREETDRLDLVVDKPRYEPGETAKVLVKSPFPEADAVLTVEREGVLSARRVHLSGAATTLDVPITEEAIPNVFVSVVLVRGRVAVPKDAPEAGADPGRPQVRVGYAKLEVERKAKRLTVAIAPDRAEKRPRDAVEVKVKVTDHLGKGAAAEVTVWAVDEGVLRLTGYQVPDPVALIHPERGLSVRIGEPLIHLVERRRYGEKGLTAGGGGGDGSGAGFRSRFETTALFAPEVRTDADGNAVVRFQVPDNLTTWRIMAVAVTKGDRMGAGEAKVAVAKPLMALPALPRVARVGDRFEAGVVVHAPNGAVKEAAVRVEAAGLALEGPATRTVSLDGKPREVRFRFQAAVSGEATLRFFVTGGGEKDGVEQKVPVRLPLELEAVATYGDTKDVRREALVPPGGVRPDVGGLEVSLASTALGGFGENMRQLVEYPHGCLEQLSSRLVPFVALRELQGKLGQKHEPSAANEPPEWARAWLGEEVWRIHQTTDPDEVVRRTVTAIEKLQNPDGGYRYWPDSVCSADWASSYAVLALGRAAELGYPVDRTALAAGQKYLADTVAAGRCTRCNGSCSPPSDPTRVFALYTLARTRAPRASYYGELFARRKGLPLFSQAMLADAMFVGGGDRADARTLLQELLNHAKETAAEVHFEETDPLTYATLWSSDTRTTGIVLGTLADVAPDHPYVAKLAAYLAKVRKADGRFRNTQEAAFALMSLAEVVRTKEKDVPDFTGRVTLGGKPVAEARFQGRSTEVKRTAMPMKDLPASQAPLPFDFRRDGKSGVLYYGAVLRYAPAALPKEPLERGIFVQRWFEPYEGGGQVRAARAGDLVRVRVRIGTSQERHYVAITVPLPSGLEIVDTSLASTAAAKPSNDAEGPGERYDAESAEEGADGEPETFVDPWAFRFWSPFNHEEKRDDRLVLFADELPPGVHVATLVARATTPGTFVLAPAHAEEMYTPEVFGRSDGGTFEVKVNEPVAGR